MTPATDFPRGEDLRREAPRRTLGDYMRPAPRPDAMSGWNADEAPWRLASYELRAPDGSWLATVAGWEGWGWTAAGRLPEGGQLRTRGEGRHLPSAEAAQAEAVAWLREQGRLA